MKWSSYTSSSLDPPPPPISSSLIPYLSLSLSLSLAHSLPTICFVHNVTNLKVECEVTSRSSVVRRFLYNTAQSQNFNKTRLQSVVCSTAFLPISCPTGVEKAPKPKNAISSIKTGSQPAFRSCDYTVQSTALKGAGHTYRMSL